MIFSLTLNQVLDGTKTQTCRLAAPDDREIQLGSGEIAVARAPVVLPGSEMIQRYRWIVGRTYAVQAERCARQSARIRMTAARWVASVPEIADEEFAHAEGFKSLAEFLNSWRRLHGRNADKPAWVLSFELVNGARR